MRIISQRWFALLVMGTILTACNINLPEQITTPTVEVLLTDTPTPEISPTPSPSPTATATEFPQETMLPVIIDTVQPGPPSGPPTLETIPSETPGPWTYTIQENDTLGVIMQRQPWGYPAFDPAVIAAIVALNPNMTSADVLPPIGSEILIPRRTATPIPEGIELTQAADRELGVTRFGSVVLAEGATTDCHIVAEGETIVGIADLYDTTLEVISQFNQTLNWAGCDFTQYSGGPNCSPLIQENQCIIVPQPTPVPTSTPTPSGSETPTMTPTYPAPRPVNPAEGAVAPPGIFELGWVSAGILKDDEAYLVEIENRTNGSQWRDVTRNTSIMVPASMIPTDGQTNTVQWRVSVARRDADGSYAYVGGIGAWRTFQWQSR